MNVSLDFDDVQRRLGTMRVNWPQGGRQAFCQQSLAVFRNPAGNHRNFFSAVYDLQHTPCTKNPVCQFVDRGVWTFALLDFLCRDLCRAGIAPPGMGYWNSAGRSLCGRGVKCGSKMAMKRTPDGKMPGESHCSPREIQNYLGRISGPLLDRIDLHVEVPAVKFQEITSAAAGEPSARIRERVVAARERQQGRFAGKSKVTCNARMGSRELRAHCGLDAATMDLLKYAMNDMQLSARAYDRVLKVGRTIADLAGSERISGDHISEAIQYRTLDRQLWM
jgi:hypothetical protein